MKIIKNLNIINLFLIFHFFISLIVLLKLNYFKVEYILFSSVFGVCFYISLKKMNSYSLLYLTIFLYLGFWLKFTYFSFFNNPLSSTMVEMLYLDDIILKKKTYSKTLLISSFNILTIYILYIVLNKINFFNTTDSYKLKNIGFYLNKFNKLTIFSLLSIFILIYFLNIEYSIYQKGILETNYLQKLFYIFLILGFSSLVCLLVDNTKELKKKIFLLIISTINGFFLNLSILSRTMILHELSIFYPTIKRYFNKNFFVIISLLFLFLTLCYVNVKSVNYLRLENFNNPSNKTLNIKLNKVFKKETSNYDSRAIERLFFYRWVGFDGLFNVLLVDDRNVNLITQKDAYQNNFIDKYQLVKSKDKMRGSIVTPGIISIINYSNNFYISSSILILIITCLFFLEKIILHLTGSISLTSFLTFILVWRLIHMGNSLNNTIILYLLLLFLPLFLFIINKIIKI